MMDSEPEDRPKKPFQPSNLNQTVIAIPLLRLLAAEHTRPADMPPTLFSVIIDLNLEYPGGREGAKDWVVKTLNRLMPKHTADQKHLAVGIKANEQPKNQYSQQYLFVRLEAAVIEALVEEDRHRHDDPPKAGGNSAGTKAIYRIWPDFAIKGLLNKSISTVKGDAAQASYAAFGAGIVWAVMDSGIDHHHKHLATYNNLNLKLPLKHTDFTGAAEPDALQDAVGHGTHVA